MHVRIKKNINEVDILKENKDSLKRVMAGMGRKMKVCLQRNVRLIEGNGNWPLTALGIRIDYVFVPLKFHFLSLPSTRWF